MTLARQKQLSNRFGLPEGQKVNSDSVATRRGADSMVAETLKNLASSTLSLTMLGSSATNIPQYQRVRIRTGYRRSRQRMFLRESPRI